MTQATTISPTAVHSQSSGPCRSPNLYCPPPPCACPEVVTLGRRILRILWFLTKLGFFVGVIKFTIDEGLWGESEETEDLAKRMGIYTEEKSAKKEKLKLQESPSSFRVVWNNVVMNVGKVFGLDP